MKTIFNLEARDNDKRWTVKKRDSGNKIGKFLYSTTTLPMLSVDN